MGDSIKNSNAKNYLLIFPVSGQKIQQQTLQFNPIATRKNDIIRGQYIEKLYPDSRLNC